jgi:hypothetical protein
MLVGSRGTSISPSVAVMIEARRHSQAKSVSDGTAAKMGCTTLRTVNVPVSTMPTELSDAPYAASLPFSLREHMISVKC